MATPSRIIGLALLLASASCSAERAARVGQPDHRGPGPAAFMAGAARRPISPDLESEHPVFMGGFTRGVLATAIHDDLWARALVLTDATGISIGLVTLDLVGFFHDDVEALRSDLAERHPDVAIDYLAVASTHNHAGPDVIGLWTPVGGSVDADYIARIRREAADAVAQAWRERRPARIYLGVTSAHDLLHDARLPLVIDDTLLVMGLMEAGGERGIAALVNWNSHPGVVGSKNTTISADFPHGTIRRVESEWGGVCLYASGALGGQIGSNRVRVHEPGTGLKPDSRLRRAELLGDAVGAIAIGALERARNEGPEASPVLRIRKRTLYLPVDNDRFERGLSIGLIRPRRLYPQNGDGPGWLPSDLPERDSLVAGATTIRTEVATVDLGSMLWAMIPGELYPELSLGGIQDPQDPGADYPGAAREPALRGLSDRPLFLIGLANDEIGYIIPKSQWDAAAPYAYGLDEPQYGEQNSLGPETAPLILDAFRELFTAAPSGSILQQAAIAAARPSPCETRRHEKREPEAVDRGRKESPGCCRADGPFAARRSHHFGRRRLARCERRRQGIASGQGRGNRDRRGRPRLRTLLEAPEDHPLDRCVEIGHVCRRRRQRAPLAPIGRLGDRHRFEGRFSREQLVEDEPERIDVALHAHPLS